MSKIAVMGFGNPCRSDDGVGIYVLEQFKAKIGEQEHISFFDMGTGAFETLYKLVGHDQIILIDAVINSGEKPGTLYKVPAEEVLRAPENDPMVFLHSIKWDQALSYSKKILRDQYPENIMVYLIAVDDTKLDIKLSTEVKSAGDKLVDILEEDIIKSITGV